MATRNSIFRAAAVLFGACVLLIVTFKIIKSLINLEFEDQKQIQGVWLGSLQSFNGHKYPFPLIYDFKPNNSLEYIEIGTGEIQKSKWSIENGKLHIDTFSFDLLELNDNKLVYNAGKNLELLRISSRLQGKTIDELYVLLGNSSWNSIKPKDQFLNFGDSAAVFHINGITESRCWEIKQYKSAFLLFFRESESCTGSAGRVFQIMECSPDRLVLKASNEIASGKFVFTREKLHQGHFLIQKPEFQFCGFYPGHNHLSISDANARGGRYVEETFLQNFECDPSWKQISGYLRLKFLVNCKGRTGFTNWQSMDKNYIDQSVPESLTIHLEKIFSSVKGWQPLERNDQLVDAWKSIIFKIEGGVLVSVSP